MKRLFIIAAAALLACSCSKESAQGIVPEEGNESVVYISLQTDASTKATGSEHGANVYDNSIRSLEVFVYNINEGAENDGELDGYRKYSGAALNSVDKLEVKATLGRKMIYVLANSHFNGMEGLMTRSDFEAKTADLFVENTRNFMMIGGTEETLQLATSVSITIRRMISRVSLKAIRTSFDGTPYEGCSLTNVKAYLTNVQGEKMLIDGSGKDLKLLNYKKYKPEDCQGAAMEGILCDDIAETLDKEYTTSHYFYCYENDLSEETETDRFTRLVVEAQLKGKTYYYPVAIPNLKRNSCYSVEMNIQRPGALDPDSEVETGTLDINVDMENWNLMPNTSVVF